MDNKVFKIPRLFYLGAVLIVSLLCPIAVAIFVDSWGDSSYIYRLVGIALMVFALYVLFFCWSGLQAVVIITDQSLILKRPYKSFCFDWNDISEVGRSKSFDGTIGSSWRIYVKCTKYGDQKFYLHGPADCHKEEIRPLLFERATKAKFVSTEDISLIPFIVKKKSVEWDIND